jgi:UDP-glucose 4-epimerase
VRVAVTGGKGFIGRAVVSRLLFCGHEAVSLGLEDGFDVRQPFELDADACIHLAGMLGTHELFDDVRAAVSTNVLGTVSVLDACVKANARYVGITMPQVFPSVYTATKVCATRLASAYHHTYDLPVSHVRAYNAFGPGQAHGPGHPQKIVPTFAVEAWAGRPIPIWGDGEQTVDLISTRDLAKMLVQALDFGDDETFDGGTGKPFTVNQVAAMVLEITDSKAGVVHLPMRRGEVPTEIVADDKAGWKRLGWRPAYDRRDLVEAVFWYMDHPMAAAA